MSIIIKGSDNFQSVCSIFFNRRINVWNYNIDCTCLSHLYGKILRSLGFYLVRKTLYYPISLGNFKFLLERGIEKRMHSKILKLRESKKMQHNMSNL